MGLIVPFAMAPLLMIIWDGLTKLSKRKAWMALPVAGGAVTVDGGVVVTVVMVLGLPGISHAFL